MSSFFVIPRGDSAIPAAASFHWPWVANTVQSTHCSMASIVSPRAVNSSGSRALGKEAVDMWE